jgi:deoxyribose-phosphate aldolase
LATSDPTQPKHAPPDDGSNTAAQLIPLASRIQSTLISNTVTAEKLEKHIDDCILYGFNAAMIPPAWVGRTRKKLHGFPVKVASFVDFPLGTMTSAGKADEARRLLQAGVQELDLMPNVGFLLSGMEREYFEEIAEVVRAAESLPLKIMLELPLLDQRQRERAIALSLEAGVAYLKNASGGAVGVATVEDIRYLRASAPPKIGVKASGGIKTAEHARALLLAGADLLGTSSAVRITQEDLQMTRS